MRNRPSLSRLASGLQTLLHALITEMSFFLRKLVEALLLPIGISCAITLLGIILRRRWISFLGVVSLYVFSTPVVGRLLLNPLEHAYPPETVASSPEADAIIVLGGGVVRGISNPGIQWGESANRYFTGFDLATAGKSPRIVFTGAASDDPAAPNQGEILRQAAIAHGIQPERIIVTGRVLTTEEEARAVSAIPGIHSILLVTSAFHMPRAVLLFRARGLNVLPFPTDEQSFGRPLPSLSGFIPVSTSLRRSEQALREYYGLAVYRILLLFR